MATDHGTPGILLWRDDPRRGRIVVAHCHHCRRAGVRLGMSVAQAVELARPGQFDRHDPGGDAEAIAMIAEQVAQTISPMVAIEPLDDEPWAGHWRHQSESLWIDITGVDHLFEGHERGILRAIGHLCRQLNLHPRMGIADTPAAAWALAHYADDKEVILSPGHGVEPLLALPVESLRVSEATVATLTRLGVTTVGELLRLPRSGVASRLGTDLIRRVDQITGQLAEPVTVHDAPAELEAKWDMEYPTMDVTLLADRMRRCVEAICGGTKARAGLALKGHGAQCVTCRLDLSDHPPLAFEVGLFAPSRDVDHLHGLLVHHLESASLRSDVVRLTLSVVLSAPMRTEQVNLFDWEGDAHDGSSDARSRNSKARNLKARDSRARGQRSSSHDLWRNDPLIARLVDSMAGRMGRAQVVQPCLTPDPLPESAVSCIPMCAPMLRTPMSSGIPATRSSGVPMSSVPISGVPVFGGLMNSRSNPQTAGGNRHSLNKRHRIEQSANSTNQNERKGQSFLDGSFWGAPTAQDAMRRPLALLDRPMPLLVLDREGRFVAKVLPRDPKVVRDPRVVRDQQVVGKVSDPNSTRHPPSTFRTGGVVHRVTRWWGPERIETNWWKGSAVARDYFRVETHQGAWWWIFRERGSGHEIAWFLHGRFA